MDINQLDQADESACLIAETPTIPDPISIAADLAPTFTFASHQNSIPVIRAIRISNPTPDALESLRLELTSQPAFLRPKTWTIDRILASDEITLTDRRGGLGARPLGGPQ